MRLPSKSEKSHWYLLHVITIGASWDSQKRHNHAGEAIFRIHGVEDESEAAGINDCDDTLRWLVLLMKLTMIMNRYTSKTRIPHSLPAQCTCVNVWIVLLSLHFTWNHNYLMQVFVAVCTCLLNFSKPKTAAEKTLALNPYTLFGLPLPIFVVYVCMIWNLYSHVGNNIARWTWFQCTKLSYC